MEFKEYLLEQEIFEYWIKTEHDRLLKEGILTGIAGTAANLTTQALRGGANIIGGTARSAYGLGQIGTGALEIIGGGKKKGKEKIRKGWELGKKAGKQIGRGALQVGLSPATALIRGAQSSGESPFDITGAYSPGGKKDKPWQDMFGLHSGEDEKEASNSQKPLQKLDDKSKEEEAKEKTRNRQQLFANLVSAYLSPRTNAKTKAQLQDTIRKVFPEKYEEVLKKKEIQDLLRKKTAARLAAI